jgi:hypothetical protein
MPKYSSNILEFARRGAEHRYRELNAEIASLVKHFPHLRSRSGGPRSAPVETVKRAKRRRRRRRKMSAAARKAVSARMKKYWAARRKAKA